jgi:protein disulfide-isomerase
MHGKFIYPLLLAVLVFTARAGEKIPVLQVGTDTYSNVTVTSVSATDVFFTHAGGMANVKIKTLSSEWQKHFNFDAKKARTAELKQSTNQAAYYDQLLKTPTVHPVASANGPAAAAAPEAPSAAELAWRQGLSSALRQAQAENKHVLLAFTGSDWCMWCLKFDHDVLSTDRFASYAKDKLILITVDFPQHKPQRDDLKRANVAMQKFFGVEGFPSYVLLNSDGRVLGRQTGYLEGGPEAFIAKLDGFIKP